MGLCILKNPPEFSLEIEKWTKQTKDNGEEMAIPIEKLLNNTFFNKIELERHKRIVWITFAASGWIGNEAPYTQTVEAEGITESDSPILVSALSEDASVEEQKAYMKAFSVLAAGTGTTGDGVVTINVYKKPVITITVGLKGA